MTVLVGDNTETSVHSPSLTGNPSVFSSEFTAAASGYTNSGEAYLNNSSGTAYMVVYSAAGALLAQSDALTLSVAGWQTFTFSTLLSITSGTQYWVGVYVHGGGWNVGLGGTGVGYYSNTGTWPTAPGTLANTGKFATSNNISAYLIQNTTVPTISAINSGSSVQENATAVPVTGTNFDSTLTLTATQGSFSAALSATYVSATSATFDIPSSVTEPASGAQLAYGSVNLTPATTSGGSGPAVAFTYVPPAGQIYETCATPNPTQSYMLGGLAWASGDQAEVSGDSSGASAPPPGVQIYSDMTHGRTAGAQLLPFWFRRWEAATSRWGSWTFEPAVVEHTPGQGFFGS